MKKTEELNEKIIYILLIVYLISFLIAPLFVFTNRISPLINILFYLAILYINRKNFIRYNKKIISIYLIQIILLLLCFFIKGTGVGSILSMLNLTSMLIITNKIRMSNNYSVYLKYFLIIYYILFIIINKSHLNPNYIGYIFLWLYLIITFCSNLTNKKNLIEFTFFSLITVLLIYLFKCRSAILACVLFYTLIIFFKNIVSKKYVKLIIPLFAVFGSIMFALLYIGLWKSNFYIDIRFFAGKNLFSGRNLLWYEAFSLLLRNPLFGVGSKQVLSSLSHYALHNTVLMVMVTFGIPNLILYYYNIKEYIKEIYSSMKNSKYLFIIVYSIVTLLFVDYFEGYTYWSTFNTLVMFIVVYMINDNFQIEKKYENNKKRIYIFEEGIDRIGGVERIVSTLSNSLCQKYDINVVSFYRTREEPFFTYNKNVRITYLCQQKNKMSIKYKKGSAKYYFFRIIEKIIENTYLKQKLINKIQEININDTIICGRLDVAVKVIPLLTDYKKIIVRDAIHYNYYKKSMQNKILKNITKISTLIVSSEESKEIYLNKIDSAKTTIIKLYNPLGIIPIVKYNYDNHIIISVGRYSTQKGFENLIKAFNLVYKDHKDWKLKIVGANDKVLTDLVKELNIENSVILINDEKNIVRELNNSSIFVMTSRYEGYANALVEAMACGVPSISYDWLCGADDIINDNMNGLIVRLKNRTNYFNGQNDVTDILALKKAMIKLIDNKKLCDSFSLKSSNIIKKTRETKMIISKWEKIIDS